MQQYTRSGNRIAMFAFRQGGRACAAVLSPRRAHSTSDHSAAPRCACTDEFKHAAIRGLKIESETNGLIFGLCFAIPAFVIGLFVGMK